MTPRIFTDAELSAGRALTLPPQSSHHLAKVLRACVGDAVVLFNGDGRQYRGWLTAVDKRGCEVNIDSVAAADNESPLHITLLQGLSRNDRMDTTLQKATELGINAIVPVICKRSRFKLDAERTARKLAHWKQIVISACEQSGRCVIPELSEPMRLDEALDVQGIADCRIVLAPEAGASITEVASLDERVSLLIGPESGLEDDELAAALGCGYQAVRLGPRVLRTETAGPAAIAAIQTLWGDFS